MDGEETIRLAKEGDIPEIEELLRQVHGVHARIRPDLFIEGMQKYDKNQLSEIIADKNTPVFVCVQGGKIAGYVFCRIIMEDAPSKAKITTLYIDDLCVDESLRSRGTGKKLFAFACDYAKSIGAYNLTLHVYSRNERAEGFYRAMGLVPQYTALEKIL